MDLQFEMDLQEWVNAWCDCTRMQWRDNEKGKLSMNVARMFGGFDFVFLFVFCFCFLLAYEEDAGTLL